MNTTMKVPAESFKITKLNCAKPFKHAHQQSDFKLVHQYKFSQIKNNLEKNS